MLPTSSSGCKQVVRGQSGCLWADDNDDITYNYFDGDAFNR